MSLVKSLSVQDQCTDHIAHFLRESFNSNYFSLLNSVEEMYRSVFYEDLLLGGIKFAFREFKYCGIQTLFPFDFEEIYREMTTINSNNIER